MEKYKNLSSYGVIGDLITCALISNEGSIDWFSPLHMESPSMFGALLDYEIGGTFQLAPLEKFASYQEYIPQTNILETHFQTVFGKLVLTDFMPFRQSPDTPAVIMRKMHCEMGKADFKLIFKPRFNYAMEKPSIKIDMLSAGKGYLFIEAATAEEKAFLTLPKPYMYTLQYNDYTSEYSLKEGETAWFILEYDQLKKYTPEKGESCLIQVENTWKQWLENSSYIKSLPPKPLKEMAQRSSLVVKLLTNHEKGAVYMAPATSLPEKSFDSSNWDYRFCGLSYAATFLKVFSKLGFHQEVKAYVSWLFSLCEKAATPEDLSCLYTLYNENRTHSQFAIFLEGYKENKPVRIGHDKADHGHIDACGEFIHAIFVASQLGYTPEEKHLSFIESIATYVCNNWQNKYASRWYPKEEPQHYLYSKLMCWVALDRATQLFENAPQQWKQEKDTIHHTILEKCFNTTLKSFVQCVDSDTPDASALLIPLVGMLPVTDDHIQATIHHIQTQAMINDTFVYNNHSQKGSQAEFIYTFWFIQNLVASGKIEKAKTLLKKIIKPSNVLQLLSESINLDTNNLIGNFPVSFSHLELLQSIIAIENASQLTPNP